MIKLLGVIDLMAFIVLLSVLTDYRLPYFFIFFTVLMLLIKAGLNLLDPGGITDISVSLMIVLSIPFNLPAPILVGGAILIFTKGALSLL